MKTPLMAGAFRTLVCAMPEYTMVFKFESLADLHKADEEWRASQAPSVVELRHSEMYVSDLEDTLNQIAGAFGYVGGVDGLIAHCANLAGRDCEPANTGADHE